MIPHYDHKIKGILPSVGILNFWYDKNLTIPETLTILFILTRGQTILLWNGEFHFLYVFGIVKSTTATTTKCHPRLREGKLWSVTYRRSAPMTCAISSERNWTGSLLKSASWLDDTAFYLKFMNYELLLSYRLRESPHILSPHLRTHGSWTYKRGVENFCDNL